MWHVHGSWSTAFVQGMHDVVVPVLPDRSRNGLGLPTTYEWPETVREMSPEQLAREDFDVVILQRPEEIALVQQWTGRRAGVDLPAVYVEHNTPKPSAYDSEHPMSGQRRIPIAHVTHYNALMWDNGEAPVRVIEHGIPDPGHRYSGMLPRVACAVNEPVRRGRVTGTDLIRHFAAVADVDVFGMGTQPLTTSSFPHEVIGHGDVPHAAMHDLLAHRRVYAHLCRYTSLGLSLLEAMYLGMPVVALSVTEAPEALAGSAAVVSNDLQRLQIAVRDYLHDPDRAVSDGRSNRAHVLARHALPRFHAEWDQLLKEVLG